MTVSVTFPGSLDIRAGGADDQHDSTAPDWGVYADPCWEEWPGVLLAWPDFGVPRDDEQVVSAIVEAVGRARHRQDVLVGCRGGIGRTGTLLAALAIACGIPAEGARAWVRSNYHPRAVETDAQHEWLMRIAQDHRILRLAVETKRREVDAIERRLRDEMSSALHAGDPLPRLAWAIPGRLAISQRPLRPHPMYGGSRRDYPPEARPDIDAWIADVVRQGIRSVIVLTSNKELQHYAAAVPGDGGLLSAYREAGLDVHHLPADDPAHDLTARAAFDAAVDELSTVVAQLLGTLRVPALLHCSAAIDRSPPVAARVAFLALVGAV
jgi:predicted protein tyrosine phosphatase